MDEVQIKRLWRKLTIPFFIGILILVGGIIWNRVGRQSDDFWIFSIYLAIFGGMLAAAQGIKMIKFKKYLKSL